MNSKKNIIFICKSMLIKMYDDAGDPLFNLDLFDLHNPYINYSE